MTPQADIDDSVRVCREHGNGIASQDIALCTCIKDDESSSIQNIIRKTLKGFAKPRTFNYGELLAEAETLGIHVIVSNPAFQIWLLFHFVKDITPLRLDDYPKSKDRLKIVESELKKHVDGYKHGSLEMDPFSEHIREAMDNSQSTTQDLKELKRSSDTNFRDLLCSIQDKCNNVALFR